MLFLFSLFRFWYLCLCVGFAFVCLLGFFVCFVVVGFFCFLLFCFLGGGEVLCCV